MPRKPWRPDVFSTLALATIAVAAAVVAASALWPTRRAHERLVFAHRTSSASRWSSACRSASPVATADTLFFCGGAPREESLVALELRTQTVLWRQPRSGNCGTLRLAGGALYLWSGSSLSAIVPGDGVVSWERTDVVGLPFVSGGRVYLSARAKPALVVLDASSFAAVGEVAVPEVPDRPPVVVDGVATYGTRSGRLISVDLRTGTVRERRPALRVLSPLVKHGPRLIFNAVTPAGHALLAYDPAADAVAWAVDTHTLSQATPLVVGRRVLFGADRLYAVDLETGASRSVDLSGGPVGNPVLHDGTLYVAGGSAMYALDPEHLTERWSFRAGDWVDAPPTGGPPVIVDGVLAFASLDCNVYGLWTGADAHARPGSAARP